MSKNNVIKAKIDAKIDPATVSELKPTKATSFIDLVFPSRAPAKSLTKHEGYQNASKPTDHLTPKRFVFRRKVKKLSVLKKKILQERLKTYMIDQINTEAALDKSNKENHPSILQVFNFCKGVNWEDADEIEELANNIVELLSSIASVSKIRFMRAKLRDIEGEGNDMVEVQFHSQTMAELAKTMLDGLTVGGEKLSVVLCQYNQVFATEQMNEQGQEKGSLVPITDILHLQHFLTLEDLEDLDGAEETLQDIYSLCQSFAHVPRVWIEQRKCSSRVVPFYHTCNTDNALPRHWTSSAHHLLSLTWCSFDAACTAMLALNRMEIGGEQLVCRFADVTPGRRFDSSSPRFPIPAFIDSDKEEEKDSDDVYFAIVIRKFAALSAVEDEDEKAEIVSNLQDLVLASSSTTTAAIPPSNRPILYNELFFVTSEPKSEVEQEVDVYLLWKFDHSMLHAFQYLRNQVIGGQALWLELQTVNLDQMLVDSVQDSAIPILSLHTILPYINTLLSIPSLSAASSTTASSCSGEEQCVLLLDRYITEEDMEDMLLDNTKYNNANHVQEQLRTMKADLLQIIHDIPTSTTNTNNNNNTHPLEEYITKLQYIAPHFPTPSLLFTPDDDAGNTNNTVADTSADEEEKVAVCLQFHCRADLVQAWLYFDGLVLGGETVMACIQPHYQHHDDDEKEVVKIVLARDFSSPSSNNNAMIAYSEYDEVHSLDFPAAVAAETTAVSSTDLTSSIKTISTAEEITLLTNLREKYHLDHQKNTVTKANPRISKYKLAKEIPRLAKYQTPRIPTIPIASEEINLMIKEFLKMISTFQARNKEKFSAIKFKQKLRFVVGLKQVLNAVKTKHVRIVFIAPNTDVSEELDEKIDHIMLEARNREIDVMYCLSKRLLGKALQMSMKQSAVAVLDPDGAYELYRKISTFVRTYPKANSSSFIISAVKS